MEFGISGKTAFITGGSRGIGNASALALANEGVNIAICARNEDGIEKALKKIRSVGVEAYGITCDMSDVGNIKDVVEKIETEFHPIDILVNNAGGSLGTKDTISTDIETFQSIFELNYWSALQLMKLLTPKMQERNWGRVINITSIYGREFGGPSAPYMAAKASLIATAKHLAITVAKDGVCVNSIAPGSIYIDGGTWNKFVDSNSEDVVENFIKTNLPLGKWGWPEPVGATVAFLASEQASLIVGACINIDGGQSHNLF